MDTVELLIKQAVEHKKNNKLEDAVASYSEAFDYLPIEAKNYARKTVGYKDKGENRTISPEYFDAIKKYLQRDKNASHISNNIGVLFARLQDYESAKKFFEQAMDLYPDGEEYKEAITNLRNIER